MPKAKQKPKASAAATRKGRRAARGSATTERITHLLTVLRIRLQRIELTVKEPAESVLREAMEMRAVISTLERELLGG